MDTNQNEMKGSGGNSVAMPQDEAWKQAFAMNTGAAPVYVAPASTSWKSRRKDTEALKRMREQFSFFGPVTFLYAVFYTFCTYKNDAGIAFLFFILATIAYLTAVLKKVDRKLKKGSRFYLAAMVLLAVSIFCTDDARIIFFNKCGIFLLAVSLMLRTFYQTSEWGLGKYLQSIFFQVFGSLDELDRPFSDASNYIRTEGKEKKNLWYALLGVLVAVPFLLVVVGLLSSADVFFGQMTNTLLNAINAETVVGVVARTLIAFFGTYLMVAYLCRHSLSETVTDHRHGEPVLAITVTGMLTAVYLLFSGIQIFGLFLGRLQLPQGYTYAQYAREGFFQLLAVSILNLILVLVCMSFFRDSKVLKVVLTLMSLCTFIMIASSAMRMIMYINTYDLTFLRILVLWTLGLLTLLFIGVLLSIFREKFPLFRYSIVVVTILYLGLSFSHPDYIIASVNVRKQTVDYNYLESLSADAAPVLLPYIQKSGTMIVSHDEAGRLSYTAAEDSPEWTAPKSFGQRYLGKLDEEKMHPGIRTFNVSRYIAWQKKHDVFIGGI